MFYALAISHALCLPPDLASVILFLPFHPFSAASSGSSRAGGCGRGGRRARQFLSYLVDCDTRPSFSLCLFILAVHPAMWQFSFWLTPDSRQHVCRRKDLFISSVLSNCCLRTQVSLFLVLLVLFLPAVLSSPCFPRKNARVCPLFHPGRVVCAPGTKPRRGSAGGHTCQSGRPGVREQLGGRWRWEPWTWQEDVWVQSATWSRCSSLPQWEPEDPRSTRAGNCFGDVEAACSCGLRGSAASATYEKL